MVIEPRKIAPGFARRWLSQSVELVGRAFHIWFGFAVLFCLITMVPGWLADVVAIPLGLFACIVSVEIAATADNQEVRLADLPGIVQVAAFGTVRDIWQKRWVILVAALYVLYQLYTGSMHKSAPAHPAPPADLTSLWTWIATPDSPLLRSVVVLLCGQMLQGHTATLGTLTYPLQRTFGVDESRARHLLHRAMFKNLAATLFMQVVPMLLLMGVAVFLPIVTPFLLCLLPALSYVAFREMFVDDKGNREPAKQASTQLAMEGMST